MRAYPYIVRASGAQAAIKIEDPVHPLVLNFKTDGELDPGQGQFEVRGRTITGTDHGHLTFAPINATCNLETLAAANVPPPPAGRSLASDQSAVASAASTSTRASSAAVSTASATGGSTVASHSVTSSTPARTVNGGNAILVINSGLSAQPGTPNPLANHPYVLLRESFATLMQKTGVPVPAGMSPYKVMGNACGTRSPDCQKIMAAVNADAASAVRADGSGRGAFPAVAAGTYYLMISAQYNNQALVWDMPIQLKAGSNTVTLDQVNASVVK